MNALAESSGEPEKAGKLATNIVHFARTLRTAGLPVGPGQILRAIEAVEASGLRKPRQKEELTDYFLGNFAEVKDIAPHLLKVKQELAQIQPIPTPMPNAATNSIPTRNAKPMPLIGCPLPVVRGEHLMDVLGKRTVQRRGQGLEVRRRGRWGEAVDQPRRQVGDTL